MIVSVIFSAFFLCSFILFITSGIQNKETLKNTSFCLILPLEAGIVLPVFLMNTPDSIHIMIISLLALFLCSIYIIIDTTKKNNFIYIKKIIYFSNLILWIVINYSIFYIYRLNKVSLALYILCFIILMIFLVFKFHIKQLNLLLLFTISALINGFLFFILFFTLINAHTLYSIFTFAGGISFCLFSICNLMKNNSRKKIPDLLQNLLLLSGATFLLCGTVLMQF